MNHGDTCPYWHTRKINGIWERGEEGQIEVIHTANGRLDVKLRCLECRTLSGALPKDIIFDWFDPFAEAVVYRSNGTTETCSVATCSSQLIEWHHFAPRNTFGDKADDWPVMPLCREHHAEWHARMDGYLWHRKRIA